MPDLQTLIALRRFSGTPIAMPDIALSEVQVDKAVQIRTMKPSAIYQRKSGEGSEPMDVSTHAGFSLAQLLTAVSCYRVAGSAMVCAQSRVAA